MKAPFKLTFWTSTGVLAAVLPWMIWQCSKPLLWIVTGDIFRTHFRYVNDGMACDSFNCMTVKLFFVPFILSSIVFPIVGLLRWTSPHLNSTKRMIFRALSLLLSLFPLSAMADVFIAVGRLTLDMGITPKRILGLGAVSAAIFTMLVYLWIVLQFNGYESAEQSNSAYRPTGSG